MFNNLAALIIKAKKLGFFIVLITVFGLLVTGCTINRTYEWTEYKFEANRITNPDQFMREGSVSIINAQTVDESVIIAKVGARRWYASYKQLTDNVVEQLTKELKKRKIAVSPDSSKTLQIKVVGTDFKMGMWNWRGTMNVHIRAGNNYTKDILASNSTPGGVDEAFSGAVAIAVIEILNNPDIREYLQN